MAEPGFQLARGCALTPCVSEQWSTLLTHSPYSQEGGGNHCASCWVSSRRGVTACPHTQLAASGPGADWRTPARVVSCSRELALVGRSSGPRDRSTCGEGLQRERRHPRVRRSPWHTPVVASPGDGSVLVAALLLLVLGSTATGLGEQPNLGFCQHIWGWDKWSGVWLLPELAYSIPPIP